MLMENEEAMETLAGKYLTFLLCRRSFAFDFSRIQEVTGMMKIVPLPRTPPFVRGVVNQHGTFLPVVDLRRKLGIPHAEDTEKTSIVIVRIMNGGTFVPIGLVVDEVSGIVELTEEQIDRTPSIPAGLDGEFILGFGKRNGEGNFLLDVDKVLGVEGGCKAANFPATRWPETRRLRTAG